MKDCPTQAWSFRKLCSFCNPFCPGGTCSAARLELGRSQRWEFHIFPFTLKCRNCISECLERTCSNVFPVSTKRCTILMAFHVLTGNFYLEGVQGEKKESLLPCLALFSCSFPTILLFNRYNFKAFFRNTRQPAGFFQGIHHRRIS